MTNFENDDWLLPEFFLEYSMDLKDEQGRPFGELNASESARQGVLFEMKTCKYEGSRFGKKMNVTALKAMMGDWNGILEDLCEIRGYVVPHFNLDPSTLRGLWFLSQTAISIHCYLNRRAANPVPSGKLPPRIAGLFKASQGLYMTTEHMAAGGYPLDSKIEVDNFMDYTDSNNIFIIQDRACSGPKALIEEFVGTALHGGGESSAGGAGYCSSLIQNVDGFLRYVRAKIELHLISRLFALQDAYLRNQLPDSIRIRREPPSRPQDLAAKISGMLANYAPRTIFDFSEVESDEILTAILESNEPRVDSLVSSAQIAAIEEGKGLRYMQFFLKYLIAEREFVRAYNALKHELLTALEKDDTSPLTRSRMTRFFPNNIRAQMPEFFSN